MTNHSKFNIPPCFRSKNIQITFIKILLTEGFPTWSRVHPNSCIIFSFDLNTFEKIIQYSITSLLYVETNLVHPLLIENFPMVPSTRQNLSKMLIMSDNGHLVIVDCWPPGHYPNYLNLTMICLSNCLGPNSKIELPTSVFFSKIKKKSLKPKWQLPIRRCRKSGDHAQEDLAKSGYKPDLEYQTLFILLCLWLW